VPATVRSVRIDVDLSAGLGRLGGRRGGLRPSGSWGAGGRGGAGHDRRVVRPDYRPEGLPLGDDAQPEAPWACTGLQSRRGFRHRGQCPKGTVLTRGGKVRLAAWQVQCRSCGRRFVPILDPLGVAAHARPSVGEFEPGCRLRASSSASRAYWNIERSAAATRMTVRGASPAATQRSTSAWQSARVTVPIARFGPRPGSRWVWTIERSRARLESRLVPAASQRRMSHSAWNLGDGPDRLC